MFLVLGLFQTADESVGGYFKTDSVFIRKFLVAFSHPLCLLPIASALPLLRFLSSSRKWKEQREFQTPLETIIKQSYPVNYLYVTIIQGMTGYLEILRAATR